MVRSFVYAAMLGLLAGSPVSSASTAPNVLPAPAGLHACAPGDPAATALSGMAAKLGGEIIGCFVSDANVAPPGAPRAAPLPVENAFAISQQGQSYTVADLDALLSRVKAQWKDYDPLDAKRRDAYVARLNAFLAADGAKPAPILAAVKPTLVSIDRLADHYYRVTSIRTYVVEANGEHISVTRINADAVVLRRSQLIRLTIQRPLSAPADVAQVQGDIADWARAISDDATGRGAP